MGDSGAIRTLDPQLRRLLLYPLSYGTLLLSDGKGKDFFWFLKTTYG